MKKIATITAAALLLTAGTASAALIDFTSNSTGVSGSVGSNNWTLTAQPDDINQNEAGGPCPVDCQALGLAMDNDGVGVDNSEISTLPLSNQYLTLTFDKAVRLSGVAWIDLYRDTDSPEFETARIIAGSFVDGATFDHETDAIFPKFKGNGFAHDTTVSLTGTVFTFFTGPGNDNAGQPDAALAAVQVSAIPLPAGLLLMGTAMGGLFVSRRRKKS